MSITQTPFIKDRETKMKLSSAFRRFISTQKCFTLGLSIGLFMWATEIFGSPSWLKAFPIHILDLPGIPHPSNFHYTLIITCLTLWTVSQLKPNSRFQRWVKNDFFNLLHLVEKTIDGTNAILGGIATVLATCYLTTGSKGALTAMIWALLVVVQQKFILMLLLQLASPTSWNAKHITY
ncbi:MAG: hypothetical protein KGL90_09955 [Burkholderiales bacterium]|nr:hypothetical protein [Burkholderiales bacterium]